MPAEHSLFFPPFHVDLANERLGRGAQIIFLKPKTFAVLRYLVENPGRLVTKKEVRQAVWRETCVSEGVLRSYIQELREALGDYAKAPRFIETVHGRGYRFIAPLSATPPSVQSLKFKVRSLESLPTFNLQHPIPTSVGRETELAQFHSWWENALRGERQVVFVTGEPGIGKTTLVDAFVASVAAIGGAWVGHGQCVEHYGAGEAYLPVLDALGCLCREPGGQRLIALLWQYAPTWSVQMPWLVHDAEQEELQRKIHGARRERMVRELAEAVEALTAERPLILVLEDLQWSDASTLDVLSFVARRREPARLLVIGIYRSAAVLGTGHPLCALTQELQLHGHGTELRLRCLTEAAVLEYLAALFADRAQEDVRELARLIHRRTEGNPLFMVNLLDDLKEQGVIKQTNGRWALQADIVDLQVGAPEDIRQMIE